MNPIIRITIIAVVSFLIAAFIATLVDSGLFEYRKISLDRLAGVLEGKEDYDLLFIGSSKVYRGVYPKMIDSICHISSYNAGWDGAQIPDFEMTLSGYLVNHPAPELVVLTLDLGSFATPHVIHDYPMYYSFLDNREVSRILNEYGYHTHLIRTLPFLRITQWDDYAKINGLRVLMYDDIDTVLSGDFLYKGYMSNTSAHMKGPAIEKVKRRLDVSEECISHLEEIIGKCRGKGIKLIFTYAPEYKFNYQKSISNSDSILNLVKSIALENNIPFLRHDTLAMCSDSLLFFDRNHLNRDGARVYSILLAEEIKKYLR